MTDWTGYQYLPLLNSPQDLRKLPENALRDVCAEVRRYIIDVVTQVGGHFGAGLGVVELTVALHYVFNTPEDKLVWDTGHQGYPHKILTGRRDQLWTIRQRGGISGFLKRSESPYDVFGAGHASTSISAALGIATARDALGQNFKVVAIVGDGAMTGGLAYEAMNNCGLQKRDLIVVLNDNRMSIAPNVWALSNYFTQLFASPLGLKARKAAWELTERMDEVGDRLRQLLSRVETGVKAVITPGMLFEALGFKYFGPVNGHNVQLLVRLFRSLKEMRGPVLLHVITQKGKGYAPAEQDKQNLHAIGKVDKITGKPVAGTSKPKAPLYQAVFGQTMVELCEQDARIVAITAAMPDGTGLNILQERFPDRVFDVGIAEAHAVTFAGGLAVQGMLPVCAIYSTFLQRAFDQIVHDIALQHLHVVFALDRAGVVGQDGPTHHGMLDLAYLRIVPGMVVMAPKDEQELRNMLYSALYSYTDGPVALRYPRGNAVGVPVGAMVPLPLGKAEVLRKGEDVAILAIGKPVMEALRAAELLQTQGIDAEVINARFVKPLDIGLLDELCERHSFILTVEDGQVHGGFGSAVLEYIGQRHSRRVDIRLHGIPDYFVEHATPEEQYRELRLDAEGIAVIVREHLQRRSSRRWWTRRFFPV
ncbi:MAG: 1-deoxy-D-xylulose-5-phosphate synthase [Candidatus Kapabacteria bacterium]|nr:1-deoxy-D-xylulose-5-phosphate synthase [Candidatus Kapabacteria bacterium]MDW8224444.1 1-deoxy-D-xylulose-5-phosphate synthase [Bacteroidota bacterium]